MSLYCTLSRSNGALLQTRPIRRAACAQRTRAASYENGPAAELGRYVAMIRTLRHIDEAMCRRGATRLTLRNDDRY
jgi:hypothetical protein